jgi:hypothetical protein
MRHKSFSYQVDPLDQETRGRALLKEVEERLDTLIPCIDAQIVADTLNEAVVHGMGDVLVDHPHVDDVCPVEINSNV